METAVCGTCLFPIVKKAGGVLAPAESLCGTCLSPTAKLISLELDSTLESTSIVSDSEFFYYFAYGSNLLAERLKLGNKSAKFFCTARLNDHNLGFSHLPEGKCGAWKGCPATIHPEAGSHVWGSVWRLSVCDEESLDRQEGVEVGLYSRTEVLVCTHAHGLLRCRSYVNNRPPAVTALPSPQYKAVIMAGALQSRLPHIYTIRLANVKHNGNSTKVETYEKLRIDLEHFLPPL